MTLRVCCGRVRRRIAFSTPAAWFTASRPWASTGACCAGSRRKPARFDDGCTAFANQRNEGVAIPGFVIDDLGCGLAANRGESVIRVHGRAVIAPDDEFLDGVDGLAGLQGKLRQGPIVIEAQHGCMTGRGVRTPNVIMKTSRMLGVFRDDEKSREEVLKLIAS